MTARRDRCQFAINSSRRFGNTVLLILAGCLMIAGNPAAGWSCQPPSNDDSARERGRSIYADQCADCHGETGEGVEGAYESALVGDETVGQLTERISGTMPEGDAESCVGEDARAVAAFIHYQFYSEAAQLRNRPPRIGIARLTGEQLRQSYADLYAAMANGNMYRTDERGLQAVYFNADRWKKEEQKADIVVPAVDFDFGREAPIEGVSPEKFYIMFKGGLYVPESGHYEIVVQSSCSFTMDFGRDGRRMIDNHVQSGDKTEFRVPLKLTGGRTYPLRINFTQRERKTESPPAWIHLKWVPPGGTLQVIPRQNLVPKWVPPTFALQTELPPDDRSYGFERGIDVNRQWDESTTRAALEFADIAYDELWPQYRKEHEKDGDRDQLLEAFLTEIAQTAFRVSELDSERKQRYVVQHLESTEDMRERVRRCLLMTLKSPYFLYPDVAEIGVSRSRRVASQLALILFDSLPVDKPLQELAAADNPSPSQVESVVMRSLDDGRVTGKLLRFLHYWLDLQSEHELTKDQEKFAGFDQPLVDDLRQSLDRFLIHWVTSENADYRQLFQTAWVYSTPRLEAFYGDSWRPADPNERPSPGQPFSQSVEAPQHRFGVLTHPYLTSSLSYHDTTSPIHRGVFLIRFVLGRNLKPPSAAFTPLSPDLHPDLTTRQRVAKQTSPQECQACHTKINGLGFALENFDAVGRFRTEEKEKPIDASGIYVDRQGNAVKFDGAGELAQYLVESPDAHRAFVNRMFQFFVKQPPAAYGPETLERLTQNFRKSGYNVRKLLVQIAVIAALQPGPESDENVVSDP